MVKICQLNATNDFFAGTNVRITIEGRPYLGATLSSEEFKSKFLVTKVYEWCKEIEILAKVAATEPRVSYAA